MSLSTRKGNYKAKILKSLNYKIISGEVKFSLSANNLCPVNLCGFGFGFGDFDFLKANFVHN